MDKVRKVKTKQISKKINPWDKHTEFYNTFKKVVWYGAADNIESAWPPMLELIRKYFPNPKGKRALDFGCGAGMFCQQLEKLGFDATGVDLSPKLIEIGKQNLDEKVKLFAGNTEKVREVSDLFGKFDLVTSVMVLQFVGDEEFLALANSIKPGGYLLLADHNPLRLQEKGITNRMPFADTNLPMSIYPRGPRGYDNIFLNFGFTRIFEQYVKQNEEFLRKNNIQNVTKNPKYMILGYKKNNK